MGDSHSRCDYYTTSYSFIVTRFVAPWKPETQPLSFFSAWPAVVVVVVVVTLYLQPLIENVFRQLGGRSLVQRVRWPYNTHPVTLGQAKSVASTAWVF